MKMKIQPQNILLWLLLSASPIFAANNDCPSIEIIKNIELVSAQQDVSGIWGFSSDYFFANGKRWKLWYATLLDRNVHGNQILILGREEFKKETLFEPRLRYHGLCIYDQLDCVVAEPS